MRNRDTFGLSVLLLGSTILSGPARADAAGDQIEDIVVTATRRTERLQEVPVAVSVVSGESAGLHALNDAQDLSTAVPTLDFRTGASNKDRDIFIRGVGTVTTSPGVDPSVSVVVDGVVLARPGQATLDLLDIDQIEVLRGPQGTLFGKNATAGAINVTTTEPRPEFHAYADAAYFTGDETRIKAGISGELIPGKLSASFSGVASDFAGNVDNLYTGQTVNGYTHDGGRAKFLFTPSDDLKITVAADYLVSRDTVPTGVWVSTAQAAYPTGAVTNNLALAGVLTSEGIKAAPGNSTVSTNIDSNTKDYNGGASATVDWAIGPYSLTSITAYRKWQNVQVQDYDQLSTLTTSIPSVADRGYLQFNQVSQEVRLASPKGGLVDYVTGFYFMHAVDNETYGRGLETLGKSGAITANSGLSTFGTTGSDYAAFGEANVNFTSDFRAILGLRLIHDDLDYHFHRVSTSPVAVTAIQPAFTSAGSTSDDNYSDRFGLQYDVSRDVTAYATYSRGYMAPAYNTFFNMVASSTLALRPETNNSYEAGLKSRWLENKLQADLAVFDTEFDNYQANFADLVGGALVTRLINAGKVSTKGVEGDLSARPIDNLTLRQSFAWTLARVDHFACPANAASSCDIDGEPLPFAPNWKLDGEASYAIPLTRELTLLADTDYRWQSRVQYQLTQTPDTVQGAYGIWNASLTLEDDGDKWRVTGLVKNLLDTHYASYLAHGNLGGLVGWVPRDNSRYFGIDVHKDF